MGGCGGRGPFWFEVSRPFAEIAVAKIGAFDSAALRSGGHEALEAKRERDAALLGQRVDNFDGGLDLDGVAVQQVRLIAPLADGVE